MRSCYEVSDPEAINCDVLLGEMAHRGLGPGLIRQFLREVAFADPAVTVCVIDPHASNARAIRAYEKAGFRFVRRVIDFEDKVPLHLMELTRAELSQRTAADALTGAEMPG
jgi:aminoglycoside 6'-N-acetyltransferase